MSTTTDTRTVSLVKAISPAMIQIRHNVQRLRDIRDQADAVDAYRAISEDYRMGRSHDTTRLRLAEFLTGTF